MWSETDEREKGVKDRNKIKKRLNNNVDETNTGRSEGQFYYLSHR
jgi:hypothetical protein